MRGKELLDKMGNIDPAYIEAADTSAKKFVWLKWSALAACLCLVVAGAFGVNQLIRNENGQALSKKAKDGFGSSVSASESKATNGDSTISAAADMVAFVVYNGNVYTQAESFYGADAIKINNLVGEYLGCATGSIDEWSTSKEYSAELASSIPGNVYTVNGYDSDFRICIREEVEGENGETELWIQFLEHLDDVSLTTGADLFESCLHLRGHVASVQWQDHDNWNNGGDTFQLAELDPAVWDSFLDQIDNGTLTDTWSPKISEKTIYDKVNQVHMFLMMEDGTVVRLRLIEGGYVGYDPLVWHFVQIPGDVFERIFVACGGNPQL